MMSLARKSSLATSSLSTSLLLGQLNSARKTEIHVSGPVPSLSTQFRIMLLSTLALLHMAQGAFTDTDRQNKPKQ